MRKWSDLKKVFRHKEKEKVSYANITCKNCDTNFDGKFCPECGQAVRDYDKPFSFIFYNFAGDIFAFDTRFFRTFKALLFKPGFLTKEYFAGRRIRYSPPFRIFIFVSFILFLLLQIYTNRGLTTVLNSGFDEGIVSIDSVSLLIADSLLNGGYSPVDSISEKDLDFIIGLEIFRDTRDLSQALNKYADGLEKELETETNQEVIAKKREYIRLCRSPEQAVAKILEYISWAFFILLPIFALILKLVYIRREHNYMRHLVFSIHIHSFIFLILTLTVTVYMLFAGNLEVVSTILLFLIPVYFIIALKRFYGQKPGKVILKFFAISFLYNLIFFVVLVAAILNALSII